MPVRSFKDGDAGAVAAIYNYYVDNSISTFDTENIPVEEMDEKFRTSKYPCLVFEENDKIMGYAYASEWKSRCAYFQTVESSVYIHHKHHGKGIGSALYEELIKQLAEMKIHTIIGGISLPNEASVLLHEKFGFRKTGEFEEVGFKFGKRINVGYWQKFLDS